MIKVLSLITYFLRQLSEKSNCFVPCLIPRPKLTVFATIFTNSIPVGPSKRTLGFRDSLQGQSNVLVRRQLLLSTNEITLNTCASID